MRRPLLFISLLLLACSHAALAAAISGSPSNAIEIRSGQPGTRVSATQPAAMPSLSVDITRVIVALAIVLGLIFFSRWILKRFYNGAVSAGGSRAVQVLHRTILAPKQQVILLQVGRRVVVVGESNGNLATLAQIEDADEIAQLVGKLNDEQSQKGNAFGGLFGRAQKKMDDDRAEPELSSADLPQEGSPEAAGQMRSELSGLLEKVKSIRGQIGRD